MSEYGASVCLRILSHKHVNLQLTEDGLERAADRCPQQKAAQRFREITQLFREAQRLANINRMPLGPRENHIPTCGYNSSTFNRRKPTTK